ncbi:MAG: RNase H family protein [Actinomycetota bacterium]
MTTTAYTDGACLGNPGPGGWAWVVPDGPYASGAEARTTNQRMEVTAAFEAAKAIDGPLLVVSDSTYVVNCFKQRWWEGWLKRGWKNSKKEPVANRDLWEPFIELYRERGDLDFQWVKGHSGDRWNDAADRLATGAAAAQAGQAGERFGEAVVADLPEDAPARRQAGTGKPEGRGVLVTGLKAKDLGSGYDDEATHRRVRDRLVDILRAKRELHDDLVVLTGLALGTEQLAAEAAVRAGVPHVAVLAFPDAEAMWPQESQARFRRLVDGAVEVRTLRSEAPSSRQDAGKAIGTRDATITRWADEAIVVSDGSADVERSAKRIEAAVGEDEVWRIDPSEL